MPPGSAAPGWQTASVYIILITLYLGLNSTLNMCNRFVLGVYGFRFPFLLTICHVLFAFFGLLPVMAYRGAAVHIATLRKLGKGLACVAVFMALNIGLNNTSLTLITLSLNQVLRASLPVVTAAVAMFVEKKVPSREEFTALLLLTSGVVVSLLEGKATGNSLGLFICCLGVLCAAAMMSTASKVLSEKLDVLQLAFYTAPVSCSVLFPFYYFREHQKFMLYLQDNSSVGVAAIILLSSCVALAYNVVHNILLQRTSAVTVTVLGEVKIVGLLILSAMLLPGESSQFTMRMTVGCGLAIAGFCMYSNAKLAAGRAAVAVPSDPAFSQDMLLELIMSDGKAGALAPGHKLPHRNGCSQPLLHVLRQMSLGNKVGKNGVVLQSSGVKNGTNGFAGHTAVPRKPQAARAAMHVVADSTLAYEVEASPMLRTKSGRVPGPASPSWTKGGPVFAPEDLEAGNSITTARSASPALRRGASSDLKAAVVELEAVKEQQGLEDGRRSSSSFARVFEALQQVPWGSPAAADRPMETPRAPQHVPPV